MRTQERIPMIALFVCNLIPEIADAAVSPKNFMSCHSSWITAFLWKNLWNKITCIETFAVLPFNSCASYWWCTLSLSQKRKVFSFQKLSGRDYMVTYAISSWCKPAFFICVFFRWEWGTIGTHNQTTQWINAHWGNRYW